MGIEEIKDTASDMLSSNKGRVLIAGVAGICLFALIKNLTATTRMTVVAPTGYTSYPDADKNANVIIDSVNQHTTYENSLTRDAIKEESDNIRDDIAIFGDYVVNRFDSTDNYIKEGFENVNKTMTDMNTSLSGQITSVNDSVNGLSKDLDNMNGLLGTTKKTIDKILKNVNKNQTDLDKLKKGQGKLSDKLDAVNKTLKDSTIKKKTSNSEYFKKFQYGNGWDSNSIVDGMKSIGIFSYGGYRMGDWRAMKSIAEANGIKNYTGTAEQNTKLVELGKAGKLLKPKG